jgi:phage shock protein PspC (stress-responsive transcriptional regulator)
MRDHTVLGVCEGLGEDFGFNPLYLRIVFAALLVWQPVYVVGVYLALGLLVLVSRLLVPTRRDARPAAQAEAASSQELAVAA